MMDNYTYSILNFLFYGYVDLYLFTQNNLEEIANLTVPKNKNKLFALLDKLIKNRLICIKNRQNIFINEISYNKNLQRGQYTVAITSKGGNIVAKNEKIIWKKYCWYAMKIDGKKIKIEIFSHRDKMQSLLKILNSFKNIHYKVYELDYWYPLYWKKLKDGIRIEIEYANDEFNEKILNSLDELCSCRSYTPSIT